MAGIIPRLLFNDDSRNSDYIRFSDSEDSLNDVWEILNYVGQGESYSEMEDRVQIYAQILRDFLSGSSFLREAYDEVEATTNSLNEPVPETPVPVEVFERFPVLRFDETMRDEYECCSICRESYIFEEELVLLPCNHAYHKHCIEQCFESQNRCPNCRFEVCNV